jgi:hypothetical protein
MVDEYGAVDGKKKLAGETEVFRKNLPQGHLAHHKSHKI